MAIDYIERALRCLKEAELATKAILRISEIEYPREHDVSPVLKAEKEWAAKPCHRLS